MTPETKKNVLLLNPPGDQNFLRDNYCSSIAKGRYFFPPTDIILMSGLFDPARFNVHILDCIAEGLMVADVLNYAEKHAIDAVIAQVASASKDIDLLTIRSIKACRPGTVLMVNGEYALSVPETVLEKHPFIDAIIHDYTSADIPEFIIGSGAACPSLSCRQSGAIRRFTPAAKGKTFELKATPRHDLLKKLYKLPWAQRLPLTGTVTSFGCPFSCNFCVAGSYDYKARPVDDVIRELHFIQQQGFKEVYFLDSLFTVDRKRTLELCRRMVDEKIDLTWSCLSRVNTFNEETLEAMKKAGCHSIQLGIESGNDDILKGVSKGFKVRDIEKAVTMASRQGINADGFFILGFPGESREQMEQTIDLAKRLPFNLVSFQLAMPLKGTALEVKNITDNDLTFDDADNAVSLNDKFSVAELKGIQRKATLQYYFRPSFIWRQLKQITGLDILKLRMEQAAALLFSVNKNRADMEQHPGLKRVVERYAPVSAKVYWYMRLKAYFYHSWLWDVIHALPVYGKVYDLGCGYGPIGAALSELHGNRIRVEGVDANQKRIDGAQKMAQGNPNLEFRVGDILQCDFSDATGVVLTDFLHHVPLELQNQCLKRIFDTLPAGGVVVIKEITSAAMDKSHYLALLIEKILYPFDTICYREESEITGYLKNLGFLKVEIINKFPHYIVKGTK